MTAQDFFQKYMGKGIDFDNFYGFQCMDLAHQYAVEVVGKDIPAAPTAKDVWDKATPGYSKITNTPSGVPTQGDILIWGVGVGPAGHIAVFDHGDANGFVSFDQNWPINSLCHYQNHNYTGVLGWLHPTAVSAPPPPSPTSPVFNDQTKIPLGGIWGDMELQAVRSTLGDQKRALDTTQAELTQANKDLADCKASPPPTPTITPRQQAILAFFKGLGIG